MSEKKPTNYLSFRVGQQWYGVDVSNVIEVLHMVALTELPAAAPDVLGLMIVREAVMPVIDLRRRFGLGQPALRLDTPIIALRTGGLRPAGERAAANGNARQHNGASDRPLGLVVDEVDDVEYVATEHLAVYHDTDSPYVTHVARLPDRLLLVLDTSLLRRETNVQAAIANLTGGGVKGEAADGEGAHEADDAAAVTTAPAPDGKNAGEAAQYNAEPTDAPTDS